MSNSASNDMTDYSMVKCKLMEPRIGTGYTFSKQSKFNGTRKYTKNNNKPRLGEQGSLKKILRTFGAEILILKVTVQIERCFRLMEHIAVISWHNPINLYITKKLMKLSKSLLYFYLENSNK